jgi:N6-adenosine-specific RNA methylase IME4
LINIDDLKAHELNSQIYGDSEPEQGLLESIKKHGILEPIVINKEFIIISGHRRWNTAKKIGLTEVPYRIEYYKDFLDEQEKLIEYNKQREKTFTQKMAEADKLKEIESERAKERQGTRSDIKIMLPECSKGQTREKIGQKIGMSGSTYERGNKVWEAAKEGNEKAKKLIEEIDKGKITINAAFKTIRQEEKHNEIKENLKPVELPEGKYNVILADPPWRYNFSNSDNRKIENHYPTMIIEEIKKLEIPSADNTVLFLWATAPKLIEGIEVLQAWGFEYKTCAIWDKEIIGMGYWFRGQHELLLVGTKGEYSPPEAKNRFSSVIKEKRDKHSKKPEIVYEIIEKMFPNGKYLELFARNKFNDKWSVWGNQYNE